MKSKDKNNLYEHLVLNEGAYFFKKGECIIEPSMIEQVFNEVKKDIYMPKVLTQIIRKDENLNCSKNALCSLLIFKYSELPSFLNFRKEDIPNELIERKTAYLLIIEIYDYVVIIKKNISHISSFINKLEVISARELTDALVEDETTFQLIKLTNMNMNSNAMRNKSYEARNLQNTMPMYNAHQSIITSSRFITNEEVCTLNINTSRITQFGPKKNIKEIVRWIETYINKFKTNNTSNPFIQRFAVPLTWKSLSTKPIPSAILINWLAFRDYLSNKQVYRKHGDKYVNYNESFNKCVKSSSECFDINCENNTYTFNFPADKITIKLNNTDISLNIPKRLSSYYIKDDNEEIKVIDAIRNLGCFIISFTDCSYIYSARRIYRNTQIFDDLSLILSVFESYEAMKKVTSEKGKTTTNSKTFPEDCVFSVVEKHIFHNADILMCDDMGNEWADHIAIQGTTISFIHSKCFNETSLSASNFQVVIGQAIKNIGNLSPSDKVIEEKCRSLNSNIKNTCISRCRKGTIKDFENKFKSLKVNPNKTKEVCLAIDFISKSSLEEKFLMLKNGKSFQQKNSVIQMIWLLNGFISICKEADLHCRIFCKP